MTQIFVDSMTPVPTQRAARGRVADQIVRSLVEAGVDKVFGIPGGAVSPLYDALIDASIEVVVTQHEGMATYMATGWSRATVRPGVIVVTSGPGVLNTTTAVAAAKQDEVPLVVLCGDVKASLSGRGSLQDGSPNGLDVVHVMQSLTKHAETVSTASRAVAAVEHALAVSMAHPRGPVVINLAMDTAAADIATTRFQIAAQRLGPAPDAICADIAQHLSTASRPVIWAGIGARLAGAAPLLLRLAERTRCPVITDVEAKGLFPEEHALSLGMFGLGSSGTAEEYLAGGVDLLLTVGARLDDTTTGGFSALVRSEGRMIQLDHAPSRLNRSYEFDDSVQCDLRATLARVERLCQGPPPHLLQLRDAAVREARAGVIHARLPDLDRAPFHPAAVMHALQMSFPRDAVFTADIGNHLIFAAQHLVLAQPDRFHVSVGLGGMGSGVGTAMGLALASRGQRLVVGICGDGSARMVGNELATCVAHDIPVVLAILNDGQLGMVEHGNERVYGRSAFCRSPEVDYVAWARALGAQAIRVERRQDVERAATMAGKGPLVIEIPIRADVRVRNPRADVFAFPDAPAAK
jgi:acetolactate synthase-1/2/3 large subunit